MSDTIRDYWEKFNILDAEFNRIKSWDELQPLAMNVVVKSYGQMYP